jgi:hypothetical protein
MNAASPGEGAGLDRVAAPRHLTTGPGQLGGIDRDHNGRFGGWDGGNHLGQQRRLDGVDIDPGAVEHPIPGRPIGRAKAERHQQLR